jgi:hypothetical protein
MDRKKIYIAVILVCFALTAGILYYNFSGSSTPTSVTPPVVVNTTATGTTVPTGSSTQVSRTGEIIFEAPVVFPNDIKFDFTLLETEAYKALVANPTLTIDKTEIGRTDPFKPF